MIVGQNAILLVEWTDKNHSWYRTGRTRSVEKLQDWFTKARGFSYAKLFAYDRVSRTVNEQLGYFGNGKKGAYQGGIFNN